ncbi:hypothetical protein RUM43_007185 [Polyplax serrata]|uniref:Uncharacterized protein n=1 Tax=Polyplax serrata TaxID=468196 RepID=A0AAN8P879_POLSC
MAALGSELFENRGDVTEALRVGLELIRGKTLPYPGRNTDSELAAGFELCGGQSFVDIICQHVSPEDYNINDYTWKHHVILRLLCCTRFLQI